MRSLWFKKQFVDRILSGEKVDTVRTKPVRGMVVGELVGAHVGPRPRFATLRVTGIQEIRLGDLDAERRKSVVRLYDVADADDLILTHISFVLVDE